MNNQDALACGGHMNCVLFDFNVPINSAKAGYQFVVVSQDVNYACALACLAQDFLDDVVVLLRPVNSAPQGPDVDQVTDDVQRTKIMLPQEVQQRRSIATARSQVRVGDPRRAMPPRCEQIFSGLAK